MGEIRRIMKSDDGKYLWESGVKGMRHNKTLGNGGGPVNSLLCWGSDGGNVGHIILGGAGKGGGSRVK